MKNPQPQSGIDILWLTGPQLDEGVTQTITQLMNLQWDNKTLI